MSELKPCPFCGGEAKGVRAAKAYHVYCTCCGADVMASTMKAMTTCQVNTQQFKAEQKWNQRAETETEKRLADIATKHATRADELYKALESTNKELYFLINEVNKYRTKDVRCDQLDPPELHDMETCHLNADLLDKSRVEAEQDDA